MKNKRVIAMITLFVLCFSYVADFAVYAAEPKKIDYRGYYGLDKNGEPIEKPIAKFKIDTSAGTYNEGDTGTVLVGETIKIVDQSTVGTAGSRMELWDFQYWSNSTTYTKYLTSKPDREITIDTNGSWKFFLNVRDNMTVKQKNGGDYGNFSHNGNHSVWDTRKEKTHGEWWKWYFTNININGVFGKATVRHMDIDTGKDISQAMLYMNLKAGSTPYSKRDIEEYDFVKSSLGYSPGNLIENTSGARDVILSGNTREAYVNFYYKKKTPPTTGAWVDVKATVDPTSIEFIGNDIQAKVAVEADLKNYEHKSSIEYWLLFAGRNEATNLTMQKIDKKELNAKHEFIITIPRTVMTGKDEFTQFFKFKARVYIKDNSYIESKEGEVFTNLYKVKPPPPLPKPVAIIGGPTSTVAGNIVTLNGSSSYSYDGATITDYYWQIEPSNHTITEDNGETINVIFHDDIEYDVYLVVKDSKNQQSEGAHHIVKGQIPTPYAMPTYKGDLKENRKITLDGSNSIAQLMYPIVWSKAEWKITPLEGGTINDVKYTGALNGVSTKDIIIKKAGKYKIELTVYNTRNISNTNYMILDIKEDIAPIADFSTLAKTFRDPDNGNKAIIWARDNSYSLDQDGISQRIWKYAFDSNNDGSFDDESWITIDSANREEVEFVVDSVGKYKIELEVKESFGQPTISNFIVDSDYKRGNTLSKDAATKIVDVSNLAPTTDLLASKTDKVKMIDVVINAMGSFFDLDKINEKVTNFLTPTYKDEKVDAKITILEDTRIVSNPSVFVGKNSFFMQDYTGSNYIIGNFQHLNTPDFMPYAGSGYNYYTPTKTYLSHIKQISESYSSYSNYHTIVITNQSKAKLWGFNGKGQLGDGTTNHRSYSSAITLNINDVVQVDSGDSISAILDAEGNLYTMGNGTYGAIGDGTTNNRLTPYKVEGLPPIKKISVTDHYIIALGFDKNVYGWGYDLGQFGISQENKVLKPTKLNFTNIIDISAGLYHIVVADENGFAFTQGRNPYGQLGIGSDTSTKSTPQKIMSIRNVVSVAATDEGSRFLTETDDVYYSGYVRYYYYTGQGVTDTKNFTPKIIDTDVKTIVTKAKNAIHLKNTGKVVPYYYYSGSEYDEDYSYSEQNYLRTINLQDFEIMPQLPKVDKVINQLSWRDDASRYFVDYNSNLSSINADDFSSISASLLKNNISFIGVNNASNEELIRKIIEENSFYGRFIKSGSVDSNFNKIKSYTTDRKPIDLYINIGNTIYDDIKDIENKVKEIVKPILENYNIEPRITVSDGERIAENRFYYKGNDNFLYEYDPITNQNTRIANRVVLSTYVADDGCVYYTSGTGNNVYLYKYHPYKKTTEIAFRFFDDVVKPNPYGGNMNIQATPYGNFAVQKGKVYTARQYSYFGSTYMEVVESDLSTKAIKVITSTGYGSSPSEYTIIYYNNFNINSAGYLNYSVHYNSSGAPRLNGDGIPGGVNYWLSGHPSYYLSTNSGYLYLMGHYMISGLFQYRSGGNTVIHSGSVNGSGVFGYKDKVYFSVGTDSWNSVPAGFHVYNETTKTYSRIKEGANNRLLAMTPDKKIWYQAGGKTYTYDVIMDTHTEMLNLNINQSALYHPNVETRFMRKLGIEESTSTYNWKKNSYGFYAYLQDGSIPELDSSNSRLNISNKMLDNNIQFIGLGTNANKTQVEGLSSQVGGIYLDNQNLNEALANLAQYVVENAGKANLEMDLYVLLNQEVEYHTFFEDKENDPFFKERWKIEHDPSHFENDLGLFEKAGQYISESIKTFNKTGKYEIVYQAQDNPKEDNRFDDYRMWSQDSATKINLYVHRKPIADFITDFALNAAKDRVIVTLQNQSYDYDHLSKADKGIIEESWEWKSVDEKKWKTGKIPNELPIDKKFLVKLEVKDREGVWSDAKIKEINTDVNAVKPIIKANPEMTTGWYNKAKALAEGDLKARVKATAYFGKTITEIQSSWSKQISTPGTWTITTQNDFDLTQNQDGIWYLHLKAKDSGNLQTDPYTAGPYMIDKTPPTPPSISLNNTNWNNAINATATIAHGTDAMSGVDRTEYKLSGGATQGWTTYTGTIQISSITATTITARTIDKAGNISNEVTAVIKQDRIAPDVDANIHTYEGPGPVNVIVTATDQGGSGIKQVRYQWTKSTTKPTSGWLTTTQSTFPTSKVEEGIWYLHMEATDNAGNIFYRYRGPYEIVYLNITATLQPNPAMAGERIHFIANTEGAAERVTVYLWNGDRVTLTPQKTPTADNVKNTWTGNYIVPLKTKNGRYTDIRAVAEKNVRTAEAPLELTVKGNIYDLVKPRIKNSN